MLKTAAARYRANLERLKTWRGRAIMTLRSMQDEQQTWVTVVSIEFAYDRASGASRWAIDPLKCVEIVGGKETPRIELVSHYGIFRDGAYYELGLSPANRVNERATRSAGVLAKRSYDAGYNYLTFDPMFFFTHERGEIDKYLLMICDNINLPEAEGSITRVGNRVVFSQEMPAGSGSGVDEVDLSQGGNPVRIRNVFRPESGPEKVSLWEWSWEEVNGVWVPKTATKVVGAKKHEFRVVWEENRVNEPLRDDEFSLVRLGLRQGDLVRDTRTGSSYTIEGAEFPPRPGSEPPSRRSLWPALAGALVLLSVLLVVWFVRRFRKGGSP